MSRAVKEEAKTTLLQKAMTPMHPWPDKEELLDVLYWGRQIFALVIGVVFGLIPVSGLLGILIYAAVSTLLGQYYVVTFQGVDEDSVGGFWELAKEGFGTAFATFLVVWITVYSALNFN